MGDNGGTGYGLLGKVLDFSLVFENSVDEEFGLFRLFWTNNFQNVQKWTFV